MAIAFFVSGMAAAQVRNVDAAEFRKLAADTTNRIIDLRTDDEIARKGKIARSRQIDFLKTDAEKQIAALDKRRTYLIYCAGGGRSGDCAQLMQQLGFRNVVNLEHGLEEWTRKGFPVEKR